MKKRERTIVGLMIATVVFIFCMRVWPFQVVKNPSTNKHQEVAEYTESELLSEYMPVSQNFISRGDFLKKILIDLDVYDAPQDSAIYAILYDQNNEVIYEANQKMDEIKKEKLVLTPKTDMVLGGAYRLELYLSGEKNASITVKLGDCEQLGLNEYKEVSEENYTEDNFIADFVYMAPCSPKRVVFYDVAGVLVGIAVYFAVIFLAGVLDRQKEKKQAIWKGIKITLAIIVSIAAIYSLIKAVFQNIFGGRIYDQVVFFIGIVVVWAILLYFMLAKKGTLHTDEAQIEQKKEEKVSSLHIVINYLQVISIGLLLHSCVMYQNADLLKGQKQNLAYISIFLAVTLLLKQFEKTAEVFQKLYHGHKSGKKKNKKHTATVCFLCVQSCLVVALLAILVYHALGQVANAQQDADALYLAKLQGWQTVLWGIVILHTVLYFRPKMLKSLSIPMAVLWAFFAIWLWTHQYEYMYISKIPIYFSIYMLQNFKKKDYLDLLRNMMNGMIAAFLLNMILSLLYRPYQRWILYRYSMYFHTVACTGEFLVAGLAAALAKFFLKIQKNSIRCALKEIILIGVMLSYAVLGMTRTTFLTFFVLLLVGAVLFALIDHVSIKDTILRIIAIVGSCVIMFCSVFSAQRAIPALVDEPFRFSIYLEADNLYGVEKGDPIDDRNYISFMRFMYCLETRISLPQFMKDWIDKEYAPEASIKRMLASTQGVAATPYYLVNGKILTYDTDTNLTDRNADNYDVSNGRIDIWKAYLQQMNVQGHDKLAVEMPDGEEVVHAHNSFIQMAHSIGVPGGIAFLLLTISSFFVYVIRAFKRGENREYMIAVLFITGFGVASLTEWLSTMTIPISVLFWLSISCMMHKADKIKEERVIL